MVCGEDPSYVLAVRSSPGAGGPARVLRRVPGPGSCYHDVRERKWTLSSHDTFGPGSESFPPGSRTWHAGYCVRDHIAGSKRVLGVGMYWTHRSPGAEAPWDEDFVSFADTVPASVRMRLFGGHDTLEMQICRPGLHFWHVYTLPAGCSTLPFPPPRLEAVVRAMDRGGQLCTVGDATRRTAEACLLVSARRDGKRLAVLPTELWWMILGLVDFGFDIVRH